MDKCTHCEKSEILFRYSLDTSRLQPRLMVVAYCSQCGRGGESFGFIINQPEIEQYEERALKNFMHQLERGL